ncbi:MAG: D-2-hydroxyacid dehydrogenase [Rikenellaceae bacterium]|nr:D-2-hydroxyacid dehydrogenase [Rikenellaceae bacterium]
MKYKIVFLDEYTVDKSDLSALRQFGEYTGYDSTEPGQIVERSKDADIVITNKTPFRADTIALLPKLKLICIAATGMNNVDLEAASNAGIEVKNAVDYSTYSVAEHTLGMALSLLKQFPYLDNFVKSGQYTGYGRLFNFSRPTYELYGKKWGIIGLGNIGKRVARLANAFGCDVSYYSTSGKNSDTEFRRVPLEELLATSDVLSVHAPLSRTTWHLLGYEQFRSMKPSAIVINVARGSLIDEAGLARAFNEGIIAGAGLDVYSAEPLEPDNPIVSFQDKDKLILTPHSAWANGEALQRVVDKVCENIRDFIAKNE